MVTVFAVYFLSFSLCSILICMVLFSFHIHIYKNLLLLTHQLHGSCFLFKLLQIFGSSLHSPLLFCFFLFSSANCSHRMHLPTAVLNCSLVLCWLARHVNTHLIHYLVYSIKKTTYSIRINLNIALAKQANYGSFPFRTCTYTDRQWNRQTDRQT